MRPRSEPALLSLCKQGVVPAFDRMQAEVDYFVRPLGYLSNTLKRTLRGCLHLCGLSAEPVSIHGSIASRLACWPVCQFTATGRATPCELTLRPWPRAS